MTSCPCRRIRRLCVTGLGAAAPPISARGPIEASATSPEPASRHHPNPASTTAELRHIRTPERMAEPPKFARGAVTSERSVGSPCRSPPEVRRACSPPRCDPRRGPWRAFSPSSARPWFCGSACRCCSGASPTTRWPGSRPTPSSAWHWRTWRWRWSAKPSASGSCGDRCGCRGGPATGSASAWPPTRCGWNRPGTGATARDS